MLLPLITSVSNIVLNPGSFFFVCINQIFVQTKNICFSINNGGWRYHHHSLLFDFIKMYLKINFL